MMCGEYGGEGGGDCVGGCGGVFVSGSGSALPFRGLVAMSSPEPFNGIVRL